MSVNRVTADRGWRNPKSLPQGPSGRALCRRCGIEVPVGRKTFCGEECIHQWKLRSQPGYLRRCVWRRDHGECALCPTVCTRFNTNERDFQTGVMRRSTPWEADHIVPVAEGGGECGLDNVRTLCRPCHVRVTGELRARLAVARR